MWWSCAVVRRGICESHNNTVAPRRRWCVRIFPFRKGAPDRRYLLSRRSALRSIEALKPEVEAGGERAVRNEEARSPQVVRVIWASAV